MRARLVRPEFWTDSTVSQLPDSTRLLYVGLWCLADDAGYLEWDMAAIGHSLFGYRSLAIQRRVVETATAALVESGRVRVLDCGRHAVIPTLPKWRISGGNVNERLRKAHFEHANGPSTYKFGTGTDKSRSESPSVSPSESVSPSVRPPRRGNGSDNRERTTTGPSHVSGTLA